MTGREMRPDLVAYLNQCGWGATQKRYEWFIGKVEIRSRNQHFLIFQDIKGAGLVSGV